MARLLQKYRLFKGLCGDGHAYTGPFYVTVDPTRRCNLRCLGCRFHSPEIGRSSSTNQDIVDFPVDWAAQLFADITALGTRTLFLVGEGEPFLHPQIFEIIRLAKRYGLHTTITSNGTLFNDERVRQVIDSGLDALHVSLWASSCDSYAQHYPGTDTANFHRVIDGLKALSAMKAEKGARKPHVTLLNPTNRFNYQDVDKMVVLAKETGCDAISFTPFKTNRGQFDRYALSAQEQEDFIRHLIALRRQIKSHGLDHTIDRFLARSDFERVSHKLPCYVCWFHSRIKVDGTVVSCGRSALALGSLKTARFVDIWNGEAYRTERIRRLAPDGHPYRNKIADCAGCGYAGDNRKIHRIFRLLLSIRRRSEERN
jgi:MoaA/NifB/PqqE/SkfB family radical SAM enzyme